MDINSYEVTTTFGLLESLFQDEECEYDHNGECQVHHTLPGPNGEPCPQEQLKNLLVDARKQFETKKVIDPSLGNLNMGHGHVFPRPDGVKVRCSGTMGCSICQADLARKAAGQGQR